MATITELMQMDFNLYSGTASSGAYSPQLLAGLPGWSIVAISTSPSIDPTGQNWIDGYFGVAYYNSTTGELVIANRGTQLGAGASTAFHNLFSDLQLGLGGPTPEQNDAQSFAVAAFNAATGHVSGMTPQFIDTVVGCLDGTQLATVDLGFQSTGGAIGRVKPHDTAFWNRAATCSMHVLGFWNPDADHDTIERNKEWARSSWAKLEPLTHGRYVNYASGEDHDSRMAAAYGENYPRLAALKKRYDPNNLFRLNANIKPA
jgi:Berberine and berberine like